MPVSIYQVVTDAYGNIIAAIIVTKYATPDLVERLATLVQDAHFIAVYHTAHTLIRIDDQWIAADTIELSKG